MILLATDLTDELKKISKAKLEYHWYKDGKNHSKPFACIFFHEQETDHKMQLYDLAAQTL
jgi:hypothetical protein